MRSDVILEFVHSNWGNLRVSIQVSMLQVDSRADHRANDCCEFRVDLHKQNAAVGEHHQSYRVD